jgi:glycosyltransferase involved in cell wall biosynthesis
MSRSGPSLLVIETHPVQYRVPVYRALQAKWGVNVHIVYGSDFSVAGYFDRYFNTYLSWDVDLLSGVDRTEFLASSSKGGAKSIDQISAKGIRGAIRGSNADAILLTGYWPIFHLHGFYHAIGSTRPILFRAETTKANSTKTLKRSLRDAFLKHLYRRCTRLLPIGKSSYQHYRELDCAEEKLIFSPYCVDTQPFRCSESDRSRLREATRSELGVAADRILLVFSGKVYEHKRPRLILEAIRLLPQHIRQRIELLVLGSGPDLEEVLADARREPAIRVICTGFLGQLQMSPYYHASDLLILPSKSETWGLVVNEALHHGIPCVVSDAVASGPDLLHAGKTGEFASATGAGLADAISRALSLTGSATIRARCRLAVSNYTVDHAAGGLYRAIQEATHSEAVLERYLVTRNESSEFEI